MLFFAAAILVIGDRTVSAVLRLLGMVELLNPSSYHRGKRVYGKARHRDAVRSSHRHTVYRYGHKWIVLTVLVDMPYTNRPFALPFLIGLYRDKNTNAAEGHRHKTPG